MYETLFASIEGRMLASAVNQYAPYALFLAILLIAAAMEWVGRHRERSANSEHD